MTTGEWIASGIVVALFAVPLMYESSLPPLKCVDEREVAEIVSVRYRTSTFRDTQGNLVSVDQATYKAGSKICMKWERTNDGK